MKIRLVPIDSIRPMPGNPRRITGEELRALRRSMRVIGIPQPIIVYRNEKSKHDGEIIGGHQRYKAIKQMLNLPPTKWGRMRPYLEKGVIPTIDWRGTYRKAKAANVALNKISGDFDIDKLGEFISGIGDKSLIRATGFTDEELAALTESLGKYTPKLAPGEIGEINLEDVEVNKKPIKPRKEKKIRCPQCSFWFVP